ncbi:zinc ribbon domain-containing protein [Corynebacterium caspium]|uniref:zinc ribbon domain-containing protein n=1 Tax=Corynebacterium caspium TaxID=234828 RepID=UPI00036A6516|nr:C4-type zinc ribbon domain-containing protein [Corynebacterium caspium]WKD59666.1 Putative zinc ribbon domain protein [Corynebacterium caspium DSM 44850]
MHLDPAQQPFLLQLAQLERRINFRGSKPVVTAEETELANLLAEHSRLRQAAGSAQMAVDDMENELIRIQEDDRKMRARIADNKHQLTAETDSIRRRDLIHDLSAAESRSQDLTAELKEAHNQIHALRANLEVHGAQLSELERKIELAKRTAEAARAAQVQADSDPLKEVEFLRAKLPLEVLAEYDEQRATNGTGAAIFNGRTCGGCFIVLPASEQQAVRNAPADEVPQCPECGSFLIRKAV